jgi:hypothetical protein
VVHHDPRNSRWSAFRAETLPFLTVTQNAPEIDATAPDRTGVTSNAVVARGCGLSSVAREPAKIRQRFTAIRELFTNIQDLLKSSVDEGIVRIEKPSYSLT